LIRAAERRQRTALFANNLIPTSRLSPQAQNVLKLIPLPNQPGTENGTLNNFVASGSEVFDNDTFNLRVDGRINERLNAFGRYSFGDFRRNGPTAFGQGGGHELVSLCGDSKVRNQSLAAGFDRSIGTTMTADFRLGYFKYKVAVLPFDFGTTPASDAGIQGLNLDDTFTSGLFGGFVDGTKGFNFGSGLGVNRCNCPLDEDEKQLQLVGNVTKLFQATTRSSSVWTSGMPGIFASPAMSTVRASCTSRRIARADPMAAASAWRRSCSATSRASAGMSARSPMPASGSGARSTMPRTRGERPPSSR